TGRNDTRSLTAFSGLGSLGESPIPYSESCRNARVGAKSNTKQTGLRISSSFGSSPSGFLMDHGVWTRNAAWKYVSGDLRFRSIRMDDHCGTVMPVVSLPQER